MTLRRMPTELLKTTRMQPVRQDDLKQAMRNSGVIPCSPVEPDGRLPMTIGVDDGAPTHLPARHNKGRTTEPQFGPREGLVRPCVAPNEAHVPSELIDASVTSQPWNTPSEEELALDELLDADVVESQPCAAAGEVVSTRSSLDALLRAQRELGIAVERALRAEQRAAAAGLRTVRASQWVQRLPEQSAREAAPRRRSRLRRDVVLAAIIGIALGGYLALFFPLIQRL